MGLFRKGREIGGGAEVCLRIGGKLGEEGYKVRSEFLKVSMGTVQSIPRGKGVRGRGLYIKKVRERTFT